MTYISAQTKKRFAETNKKTEVETVTNKKQWVIVDNKGKLVYHFDGHLLIFSRKRIGLDWLKKNLKKNVTTSWRLESLVVCITRE